MALTTTPPTNCWTQAEQQLGEHLAACQATWQYLGVVDQAEAMAGNMYFDVLPRATEKHDDATWQAMFPNIILATPGDAAGAFTWDALAVSTFVANGVIQIQFNKLLTGADEQDEERVHKNQVGDIIQEFKQRNLSLRQLELTQYGRLKPGDEENLGIIHGIWFNIAWGTEAQSE